MGAYKVKKELVYKVGQTQNLLSILEDIPASGNASRLRTKMGVKMREKLQETIDEIREMIKEFCELDEQGNPVEDADAGYAEGFRFISPEKHDEYLLKLADINQDIVEFSGKANEQLLNACASVVYHSKKEYGGVDAINYATLYDLLIVDEDAEEA